MLLKNILLCTCAFLSLTPALSSSRIQEQSGDFSRKREPLKILQRQTTQSQEIQFLKSEQIRLQKENELLRNLLAQRNSQEDAKADILSENASDLSPTELETGTGFYNCSTGQFEPDEQPSFADVDNLSENRSQFSIPEEELKGFYNCSTEQFEMEEEEPKGFYNYSTGQFETSEENYDATMDPNDETFSSISEYAKSDCLEERLKSRHSTETQESASINDEDSLSSFSIQ